MIDRTDCFFKLCHEDGVCHVSPHPSYTVEGIMSHPLRLQDIRHAFQPVRDDACEWLFRFAFAAHGRDLRTSLWASRCGGVKDQAVTM